jgi:hypothetical protein
VAGRIRYRRSGGFAGMTLTCAADLDELPPGLRELLSHTDLNALRASSAPGGADRFQHELVVDEGGSEQRAVLGDHELPADLRPLVEWLTNRARQR